MITLLETQKYVRRQVCVLRNNNWSVPSRTNVKSNQHWDRTVKLNEILSIKVVFLSIFLNITNYRCVMLDTEPFPRKSKARPRGSGRLPSAASSAQTGTVTWWKQRQLLDAASDTQTEFSQKCMELQHRNTALWIYRFRILALPMFHLLTAINKIQPSTLFTNWSSDKSPATFFIKDTKVLHISGEASK